MWTIERFKEKNYSEFRNFPVDDYVVAIDLGVQDKG